MRAAVSRGQAVSLSRILPNVRRVAPGRVLDVDFARTLLGFVYRVTVLSSEGRYMEVSVDAASSRVLDVRRR